MCQEVKFKEDQVYGESTEKSRKDRMKQTWLAGASSKLGGQENFDSQWYFEQMDQLNPFTLQSK